jgi:hypothetical protein
VTLAPLDFGKFSHKLLVSNFSAGGTTQSAGQISAYDLNTAACDSGNPEHEFCERCGTHQQ